MNSLGKLRKRTSLQRVHAKSSQPRFSSLSNIALAAFSIVISLVMLEAMSRLYYFSVAGQPFIGPVVTAISPDPVKGWKATPLYSSRETLKDASGNSYELLMSQQQDGFRLFQDLEGSPRIFIVGNSFTQAGHASDDKTWYAELARNTNAQVFAYGVGGYGTLQELMVIEEFLGRINPDAVILQVCSNDVINNSLELERRSLVNNNLTMRPYAGPDGRNLLRTPGAGWPSGCDGQNSDVVAGKPPCATPEGSGGQDASPPVLWNQR